jgi:hypothetical protein
MDTGHNQYPYDQVQQCDFVAGHDKERSLCSSWPGFVHDRATLSDLLQEILEGFRSRRPESGCQAGI